MKGLIAESLDFFLGGRSGRFVAQRQVVGDQRFGKFAMILGELVKR